MKMVFVICAYKDLIKMKLIKFAQTIFCIKYASFRMCKCKAMAYRCQYLSINVTHATGWKVVASFSQQLTPEFFELQKKGFANTFCKTKKQFEKTIKYLHYNKSHGRCNYEWFHTQYCWCVVPVCCCGFLI